MRFTSQQRLDDGVLEREFTLGEIPGVLWTPGSAPAPLILSGHNGGLHKRLPRLVARARHPARRGPAGRHSAAVPDAVGRRRDGTQPTLDLFDALGTKEKTLHANLGGHAGTPWFEVDDGARFFTRHLK